MVFNCQLIMAQSQTCSQEKFESANLSASGLRHLTNGKVKVVTFY